MNELTVSRHLGDDHDRLDRIVDEVAQRLRDRAFADAAARFADFAAGLDRHIDVEEQVLFPAFESVTGIVRGPTVVMRSEHVAIRRAIEATAAALRAESLAGATEALGALTELLAAHNVKEERVLYPMTDQALGSDAERAALVGRLTL